LDSKAGSEDGSIAIFNNLNCIFGCRATAWI